MKNKLNKEEYKMYKETKYIYTKEQLLQIVKNWNITESYIIIKSLLEFDYKNYDIHYENIINCLNKLENKTKLNKFITLLDNRKKLK